MSNYEQRYTSMPHIEIVPGETLNEKQCYHLQELLCEVTLKYLDHIGISHPSVSCRKNTGVNCYAPLEFRDECGMSVVKLSDLETPKDNKEMEKLKESILGRMKEFVDEYRRYSESYIDYHGGKAESMEVAMRIVKGQFSEVMNTEKKAR